MNELYYEYNNSYNLFIYYLLLKIIHIIKSIGKVITVRNYVIYNLMAGHIFVAFKNLP